MFQEEADIGDKRHGFQPYRPKHAQYKLDLEDTI
jgi:hypothetical protein